jgi:hypothetical protein
MKVSTKFNHLLALARIGECFANKSRKGGVKKAVDRLICSLLLLAEMAVSL